MLKNKFFTILLILTLMCPVFAETETTLETAPTPVEQRNVLDEDLLPEQETQPISYKTPVSKKKIAKKFLFAMGGVGISSLALFLILTIYNKVRGKFSKAEIEQQISQDVSSLETPDNLSNAVKIFIEKTRWS